MPRSAVLLSLCVLAAIGGGCADAASAPTDATAALATLRLVSGDSQGASTNAPVPLPLEVRAADALGQPLSGLAVHFDIASGDGIVSDNIVLTDRSGIAISGAWTLGSAEGPQQVIARAAGHEVTFTAFAHTLPGGEWLVYERGGAIWQSMDTQPLPLQPTKRAYATAVSRDGSITFATAGTNVCIAAPGDSEPRCVSAGYYNISGLAWSPDRTQVVFSGQPILSTCRTTPPCVAPRMYLLALDASSMSVRPLVVDVADGWYAQGASWSPDGSLIAFGMRGGIWLVNPDGSQRRQVASVSGYAVTSVRWSPDGGKFSVSLWSETQCPWLCDSAVGTLDADGSGLRLVATASAETDHFVGNFSHGAPIWSPDGQRIAFGRSDCSSSWSPCSEDVSVVDVRGGTPRPFLENATLLAWYGRHDPYRAKTVY